MYTYNNSQVNKSISLYLCRLYYLAPPHSPQYYFIFLFYFCRVYISLESSAILDKYFHWVCCSAFWDLSSLWRPCAMLSSNWGILEGNMMFLSTLILHVRGAHMIPKESNLEADDMTPENPTPFAFTWYISAWDFPTGLSCLSLRSTHWFDPLKTEFPSLLLSE